MPRSISLLSGNSRTITWSLTYSDDWSDADLRGDPIPESAIDSATFMLKKRLSNDDESASLTKTSEDGVAITDGLATITLDPADTEDLVGIYYATLRLFLTDSSVHDVEDVDYDNIPYAVVTISRGAVHDVL